MEAFLAALPSHLIPAVPREELSLPMAASFREELLPERVLTELPTAHTPVGGGMCLSPKGGT